jgi:hypothetical protein
VVYYRNPAKSERFPDGAVWRFYGKATVLMDGAEHDEVYDRAIAPKTDKDRERKGAAVIISIDSISDLGGKIIQE